MNDPAQGKFSDKTIGYGRNPFLNGQPVYILNCLDAAYDVKARIRLYVRDWDRKFKITDHIDIDKPDDLLSNDPTTCSDAVSVGTKCKRSLGSKKDLFGYLFNRYNSWDDDYMSMGNLYYKDTSHDTYYTNSIYHVNGGGNVLLNNYSSCTDPTNLTTMPGTGKEYAFPADDI
jgi:hypothetical protein